jgi:uncharacterized alkaline shock family protein YloU
MIICGKGEVNLKQKSGKVDTKEFEIPETIFVRDIENQVFQGIILECLSKISGISLANENFIDTLLGKSSEPGTRGIVTEQDMKSHSLSIKIEINIEYGVSIPEKAEEIQTKVTEETTRLSGLHVSQVHLVVKNVTRPGDKSRSIQAQVNASKAMALSNAEEDYTDEF